MFNGTVMNKLILSVCVLIMGWRIEVDGQKSTRSIDNQRNGLRPNNIYAGEIYPKYVGPELRKIQPADNIYSEMVYGKESIKNDDNEDELEFIKMLKDETTSIDFQKWDSIGERVISRANVSEETKRVVRQVKKQRPGFFWTLFRVVFETVNETRSTIEQIGDILSQNIYPDTTTSKASLVSTKAKNSGSVPGSADVTIKDSPNNQTSTTEAPFRLTRNLLQNIVRRNVRGLVRLFNIEWRDAINQSRKSIKNFQKDLSKSVQPFLADNPAAY
ncbi:uncharacterized protein LOC103571086 isoform X1 [Microplitis demolitor]|uniref:uncharacterized protein LOC103571086 isoform X1 n=2 Tax=Microplitis demolitor TaxID=69319 RepID=UPI0004CD81B9|nr:uncharacterized protein LOC103571086 isoform X1 [Microplitis demolitor]XP_008547311.1 uncharacterized protein LOC103571086 isoform X1 [Microplitis demolitor]